MSVAKLTSALLKVAEAVDEEPAESGFAAVEQALNVMALPTRATITRIFRGVYKGKSNHRKERDNEIAAIAATYLVPE